MPEPSARPTRAPTYPPPQNNPQLQPGDRVFALTDGFHWGKQAHGCYAQYVAVPEAWLARVPPGVDLATAGGVPLVALTAWQTLAHAPIKPGSRVLVHAGAGGVGHMAVQIAAAKGAHVVATAGPANQAFLKHIGAAEAVDYTKDDWVGKYESAKFDAVFDLIGGDTEVKSYAVLAPDGFFLGVYNTGTDAERAAAGKAWTDGRTYVGPTLVEPDGAGLAEVAAMMEQGKARQWWVGVEWDGPCCRRGQAGGGSGPATLPPSRAHTLLPATRTSRSSWTSRMLCPWPASRAWRRFGAACGGQGGAARRCEAARPRHTPLEPTPFSTPVRTPQGGARTPGSPACAWQDCAGRQRGVRRGEGGVWGVVWGPLLRSACATTAHAPPGARELGS